ncbi:MAG: 2-phosphosulfolactate phosphatase [Synechococcales cyanobacterium C42_A2020_086]|nr:2-phosphosulfolactate phosphatase [Synechococcales cyanobacterium C42_A2020_086]
MGAAISPSLTLEDWLGAGAILSQLEGRLSPGTQAAVVTFYSYRDRLPSGLRQCSSGKELVERGFATDVELAAQLNASDAVARLIQGAFQSEKDTPPND